MQTLSPCTNPIGPFYGSNNLAGDMLTCKHPDILLSKQPWPTCTKQTHRRELIFYLIRYLNREKIYFLRERAHNLLCQYCTRVNKDLEMSILEMQLWKLPIQKRKSKIWKFGMALLGHPNMGTISAAYLVGSIHFQHRPMQLTYWSWYFI